MYKRNSKEKSLRVIFYYIVYCIVSDTLVYILHETHQDNYTFIVYAIFTVVEFSAFCLFYYYSVSEGMMKKMVLPIGGLFILFACVDFFLLNKMKSFDSVAVGVEFILVILMCIYYLGVQIKGSANVFVYSTSNFWIIITFLINLSGLFFLYIMAESLFENKSYHILYIVINSAFYLLKNILLSVAMVMKSSETIKKKIVTNTDWGRSPFFN